MESEQNVTWSEAMHPHGWKQQFRNSDAVFTSSVAVGTNLTVLRWLALLLLLLLFFSFASSGTTMVQSSDCNTFFSVPHVYYAKKKKKLLLQSRVRVNTYTCDMI